MKQDNPEAQYRLGLRYAIGEGVPKDAAQAVKWYRKAADQGYANAQNSLGNMFVDQDPAEALKWYRKAADQGDHCAQNNLGCMYAQGDGVPKDTVRAYMYFNLAAMDSSSSFREKRENSREKVAKEMTTVQIAEAQKLSREWKPKVTKMRFVWR